MGGSAVSYSVDLCLITAFWWVQSEKFIDGCALFRRGVSHVYPWYTSCAVDAREKRDFGVTYKSFPFLPGGDETGVLLILS